MAITLALPAPLHTPDATEAISAIIALAETIAREQVARH